MLSLRRGFVVSEDPLEVDVEGEVRTAWADRGLIGEVRHGDEVIVNVEARDLGLGSGGFDLVHANLTRGLAAEAGVEHVMKLNYSSLQHASGTDERPLDAPPPDAVPVLVLPLHGHLAPAAWQFARRAPGLGAAYVQAGGGALPGGMSRDVERLLEEGLLDEHVTAGPSYGGRREAVSLIGGIDLAAASGAGAVLVGPGPGVIGSQTRFGNGGMAALDAAHGALALGLPTLLSPRLSAADPRPRHRGVSHHTATVLAHLLAPVEVPLPRGAEALAEELVRQRGGAHRVEPVAVELDAYAGSGLPRRTMGRDLEEDELFFAAALAGGARLAHRALACA